MERFLWAVEFLVGVGVIVSSLEFLRARAHYRSGGLLSWEVLRYRLALTARPVPGELTERMFSDTGLTAIVAARIAGAAILLAPAVWLGEPWRIAGLGLALLATLLLYLRSPYGLDGADQMMLIVLVGAFVSHLASPDGWLREAAVWFIATQATLAYLAAGIAKLVSAQWRSGQAIPAILSTRAYGNPLAHKMTRDRRWLAFAVAWSVIGFEVLFPLVILVPHESARVAFLGFGVLFHLTNAVVMGLNTFVWAFAATYPAIAWCGGEF